MYGYRGYRRQRKSARQKYVENRRRFRGLLEQHYLDDEKRENDVNDLIPAKKPKLMRKKKVNATPETNENEMGNENQKPKVKRKKKAPVEPLGTNFMGENKEIIFLNKCHSMSISLVNFPRHGRRLHS